MSRVNAYLATHRRTTSKTKNASLLEKYKPFVIKHFYWNLNKDTGTWFDIYPNEDVKGDYFMPAHQECGWLMHVRIDVQRFPDGTKEKAETFIRELLSAVGFESIILQEEDSP